MQLSWLAPLGPRLRVCSAVSDHGKVGLGLRGVAVMTETAMTAKTVKTATVASLCCIL